MRGVEVKYIRRMDFDRESRLIHIRESKNETSKRVIPLNQPAFDAVVRQVARADKLGHLMPEHYLWCGIKYEAVENRQGRTRVRQ